MDSQEGSPVAVAAPVGKQVTSVGDISANRRVQVPRPGRIASHSSPAALAVVVVVVEMVFVRYFPCLLYVFYLSFSMSYMTKHA